MFTLDPILLARIQFAFTVSFHIVFPAFTIGLASFLAVVEWRWLATGKEVYRDIYKFWVKIFAVAFGMGVVSGVVMSYQFGTNWSVFSDKIANVLGPLLGYEVAADGRLMPTNWIEIIFNPSFPFRYAHMITAAYLSTAFVVGGVGAFYLWNKRHIPQARIMLGMATIMVALVAPTQVLIGDIHGLNTLKHQPAKVAAMEGIWETEKGVPLLLFAVPDQMERKNHFEVKIPKGASLILTHDKVK